MNMISYERGNGQRLRMESLWYYAIVTMYRKFRFFRVCIVTWAQKNPDVVFK